MQKDVCRLLQESRLRSEDGYSVPEACQLVVRGTLFWEFPSALQGNNFNSLRMDANGRFILSGGEGSGKNKVISPA